MRGHNYKRYYHKIGILTFFFKAEALLGAWEMTCYFVECFTRAMSCSTFLFCFCIYFCCFFFFRLICFAFCFIFFCLLVFSFALFCYVFFNLWGLTPCAPQYESALRHLQLSSVKLSMQLLLVGDSNGHFVRILPSFGIVVTI